jgi:anti-anti-sigma factor
MRSRPADTNLSVATAAKRRRRTARKGPERFAVTAVSAGQRRAKVALHGELDAATALTLHGQLAFFHVDDPWVMVADMSDVTYIDLDGIAAIVDSRQALRSRSCTLTITNPSTTVRLMLQLCDLTGLVER